MDQVALGLGRKPLDADVSDATLMKQPTMLAAVNLAIKESGLQDNEIYPVLGMEKAAFSKACSGSNHFPADKLDLLCETLGNEIILRWWVLKRGNEMKPRQSTLERQVFELEQQLAEKNRDLETIKKFVRETR